MTTQDDLPLYNAADTKRWRKVVGHESVSATDLQHFALIEQAERARIMRIVLEQSEAGSDYNTAEKCPHDQFGYEYCEPCLAERIARAIREGE